MKTEPHENFEIITQLNQEEILEKLDTIIETDYSKYHKIKRIDKLFLGHYTLDSFYALTQQTYFASNRQKIEIKGSISQEPNRSCLIKVSISSETNFKVSLITSILFAIIGSYIVYKINGKDFFIIALPYIFIPLHFISYFMVKRKISETKTMMEKLLSKI